MVHVIRRSLLTAFGRRHPDAVSQLREWVRVFRRKQYRNHLDVRADFPAADFIGTRRTVFNIRGNAYRLVVDVRYDLGRVYTRHVVTHEVYTRLIKRDALQGEHMAAPARLSFSRPHLLRNAREYRAAVAEIDVLLDAQGDAEDRERLEFLSVLVQDYEDRTEALDESAGSPQEVVTFMLEQRGMKRSELARLMGGRARVSEFFSGRRRLSIEQVRSLRDALGILADLLVE